jgi:hypothetical protein
VRHDEEDQMLEYVYRFSIRPGKVNEFLDWMERNEGSFDEHGPDGWSYRGAFFTVRGFGYHDCELRYGLDGYDALGAGFGDEENVALLTEFFEQFLDHSHRPEAVLLKSRPALTVVEGA